MTAPRTTESGPSRRRARAQAGVASAIVGLAAAGVPMIAGGAPVHAQLLLAGVGFVALLAALVFGWAPGLTLAALAFAGEYALRLATRHGGDRLDSVAVIEAVVLFTTVELGFRSLDARTVARPERAVRVAASLRLLATIAGAAASAFVVLAVGSRRLPAPTAGLALGLAAAAALLLSAERLRRRVTRNATAHR